MKLTTDELRQIVETDHTQCGDAAAMARELLANREAQPVGFYTTVSGRGGVVWHNGAPEDDTAIYTAPPAPAYPAAKDKSQGWKIDPEYLQSIADAVGCNDDEGVPSMEMVEAVLLAATPPAPAVPEKCPEHVRFLMNMHADDLFDDDDAQEIWNACRAELLKSGAQPATAVTEKAQPVGVVSGWEQITGEPMRYKFESSKRKAELIGAAIYLEPPACSECSGRGTYHDVGACGTVECECTAPPAVTAHAIIAAIEAEQERLFGEDYLMDSKDCIDVIREMLAAAPEGGN